MRKRRHVRKRAYEYVRPAMIQIRLIRIFTGRIWDGQKWKIP